MMPSGPEDLSPFISFRIAEISMRERRWLNLDFFYRVNQLLIPAIAYWAASCKIKEHRHLKSIKQNHPFLQVRPIGPWLIKNDLMI